MCVCVCVCVCARARVCVSVCVCVGRSRRNSMHTSASATPRDLGAFAGGGLSTARSAPGDDVSIISRSVCLCT